MGEKLKIVVVGNGNAGAALVDSLLAKDAEGIEITLYGDEAVGTYEQDTPLGVHGRDGQPRRPRHALRRVV